MTTTRIAIPDDVADALFGSYDANLKLLERVFQVRLRTDGTALLVEGAASAPADEGSSAALLSEATAALTSMVTSALSLTERIQTRRIKKVIRRCMSCSQRMTLRILN